MLERQESESAPESEREPEQERETRQEDAEAFSPRDYQEGFWS